MRNSDIVDAIWNINRQGIKVYLMKPLSQRWHEYCGIRMQRDLYPAFPSKSVEVIILISEDESQIEVA